MRSRAGSLRFLAVVVLASTPPLAAQELPPPPATVVATAPCVVSVAFAAAETSGSFADSEGTVAFRSTSTSADTALVTVTVNELQLTAALDFRRLTATLDSRMTGLRRVPDLTEADHDLLGKFGRGVNDCVTQKPTTTSVKALLRVANLFSEWPEGLTFSRTVAVISPEGIQNLCSKAQCLVPSGGGYVMSYTGPCAYWNWYSYSNHDCNQCDNNEPNCQQIAQLGNHFSCDGEEWYWTGSKWKCGEPNHWSRPHIVGNCIGRCGPGCSGWDHQYTSDCTNHDTCVRNGHWNWSPYCNDEFVLAIDDYLFAPDCY